MAGPTEIARIAKCLSVETRVRMIHLLGQRVLCAGALARFLKITPGAVSQHLRTLREAGLVEPERRGNFVHYRLNQKPLAAWRRQVEELWEPAARELPCFAPNPAEEIEMCASKNGNCQKPDDLLAKPEKCSPEQIKKCHGKDKGHPCLSRPKEK